MSNIQNTFGTINAKKRTSPNPELDEESADNGFAGLIEDEVYLPEEDNNHGQLLNLDNPASADNEYFLMGNVQECIVSSELDATSHQEDCFLLNTEAGTISVTLNDLVEIGVNVSSEIINISSDQTNSLVKLVQSRGQMPSGYVSNFETVAKANEDSGKDVVNNFYAYIEEDGTVLLVEDKTDRQVAKFTRDELKKLGILDVSKITDTELQRLARNAIDLNKDPSCSNSKEKKIEHHYIGEEVEIVEESSPSTRRATIRYMRKNGMLFKVQFDDGQFNWVNSSQILKCVGKNERKTIRKTPYQRNDILNSNKEKQNARFSCCALCDKKITSKPAYIVIRLPTCRDCSETKAIMVEDVLNSIDEVSVPNNPSQLIRSNLDSISHE